MLDQLSVLKFVTGRLDAAGIAYMVTGSIAAGHYGQPRMTRDIDLVVQLEAADAERLAAALGSDFGADADTLRIAISRRGMFNVIHREAVIKIDFIVRKDTAYRVEEFQRRRIVDVDGHPLWIVSPEDLVLSKLVWAKESRSELQLRDVRGIIALQPALDWTYLEHWAASLTVMDLVREVRR